MRLCRIKLHHGRNDHNVAEDVSCCISGRVCVSGASRLGMLSSLGSLGVYIASAGTVGNKRHIPRVHVTDSQGHRCRIGINEAH